MPASAVPTLNFRDFHALAPETILAVWRLLVLMADLSVLRDRSGVRRQRAAAVLSLVGIVVAFGAALVPLVVRFDLYQLSERLNFAGVDYVSNPDPTLFFGTMSDDMLTQSIN